MIKNIPLFLHQAISNPSTVGAVIPSSRALGRLMAHQIDPINGPVVEIGSGTGAITRQILAAGISPQNLTLFDLSESFCKRLKQQHPDVSVHNRMAQDMASLGITGLGAVVSGLPLLNMPLDVQMNIAKSVFTALKPGAPMIQFTYGNKPPLAPEVRSELGLEWSSSRRIWFNLPPATVYVFNQPG